MKSRILDIAIDYGSGEGKITLKVPKNDLEWYEGLKDKEIDVEIKEHKEKRSLNANAYCWVLIQQIADEIRSTKEDVYKKFIREKGIF